MKTLAWVIFIITIPFEVLYFYKILSASKSGLNYSSIYSIDISGWQFQMGALSVLAFVLLICSYSDKKTISTLITAMGCFFYGISMISGSRIYAVVSICIIIYTYVNYIQKITFGRLILYIIGGSIFATILHAIMRLRTRGALTIPEIINFVFSSENNVLVGLLDEFGGTIYTVTIAIKEIPQNIQYNYGKSYLYSLATIGLNIGGVLNYVIKNVEYTLSFQTKYTFGGSYIGELYYNFGLFSYLVAPIIGAFIGILSKSMNYYAEKRDGYKYCYFVMAMYSCLIWVRSYCDVLTRNIAWGAILLYVVSYLINYKSRIRE